MNEFINKYKGKEFGELTVVGPEEYVMDKDGNITQKNVYCHCSCGKKWVVVGIDSLLNGYTTSCGCQGRDTFVRVINSGNLKHGDSKGDNHSIYKAWENMKFVTTYRNKNQNKNNPIEIYQGWDEYLNFKEWALSNGWCKYMSLKRRDINEGFTPKNCYWAY